MKRYIYAIYKTRLEKNEGKKKKKKKQKKKKTLELWRALDRE